MTPTAAPKPPTPGWVLRPGEPDDLNFIRATWLRGYKHASRFARPIPSEIYFRRHHEVVEAILRRPTTSVEIASHPDAPSVILGYLVREGDVVHYVYVKKPFRRFGIGRALMTPLLGRPFFFTHLTSDGEAILAERRVDAVYDPYRL